MAIVHGAGSQKAGGIRDSDEKRGPLESEEGPLFYLQPPGDVVPHPMPSIQPLSSLKASGEDWSPIKRPTGVFHCFENGADDAASGGEHSPSGCSFVQANAEAAYDFQPFRVMPTAFFHYWNDARYKAIALFGANRCVHCSQIKMAPWGRCRFPSPVPASPSHLQIFNR